MLKRAHNPDRELEEYRALMQPPEEFAEGFTWKTVIGAIFLGMIMMPASMYLLLFAGNTGDMSNAARWVTIIIFAEIARRSLKDLKMQEVYILYFMAGLTSTLPFKGLLWNQYLVTSEFARGMGIAQDIPTWWAPSAEILAQSGRTFFTREWLAPILFVSLSLLIQKLDNYGLGYVMYRITNDVEELPFPLAPVGASGIVSLTETKNSREPWRWRCFSIGGVIGLLFGVVYIGIPAVSGAFLARPIQIIPIPWIDLTPSLSRFIPATPLNLTFDLGSFLLGTVMPFWAVMGGLFGVIFTCVLNPVLYAKGKLPSWTPEMGFVDTAFTNQVDFYLSFGIGLTVAVALISLWQTVRPLMRALTGMGRSNARDRGAAPAKPSGWERLVTNNVKRGDFSIFIAIGIYVVTTAIWITASTWLVPGFPWVFFVGYAVIYVPLITYATAKLEGLCGQALYIPMAREATFILSGYKGVGIWFAPVPEPTYGVQVVEFRILELTGTKISGHIKTQLVTLPIVLVSTIVFSQLLWQLAPVPSEAYPFAFRMWDLQAKQQCLTMSATMEGGSLFMEAWRWDYVSAGLVGGTVSYFVLSALGLPTLLVFGMVRGMGLALPGAILFQALGAFAGRYYFRRRFGDMWMKYAPVLLAGFSCGMGLLGMLAIAFSILQKMMAPLVY